MALEWRTERRKVADLKDFPNNPRKFTTKGMADLKASMKQLGYIDPIAINTDGTIIGGHARKKTLQQMGMDEIDVRVPSRPLTNKEVEEAIIRLNRNTAGEWDFQILEDSFEKTELIDWGFDKTEFNSFGKAGEVAEGEDEVPEPPVEPVTKLGDIWVLGNHRVMCGDSTSIDAVEKLMGGG